MISPLCAGYHVQLNFGAVPCPLSSFNITTKIPGLDPGVWGLILSLSWVCCWTEPKQGMEDAQWGVALITDLWGRDLLSGFENTLETVPCSIRDKEGEICPYLCPEPLRRCAQAALPVTLVAFVQGKHQPRDAWRSFLENLLRCTYLPWWKQHKVCPSLHCRMTIRIVKFDLVQFLCEGNKKKFHYCFLYKDLNGTWLSSTYAS